MGGSVEKLDFVRDQLTLKVFGGRSFRVLFDDRTEFYRDGQRVALRDLHDGDRISLETVLDGTAVFARSIHMLTQSLEGDCQGKILSFDRTSGTLTLRDSLSPASIKLRVDSSTTIARTGQGASAATDADLSSGTLVSVKFLPGSGKAMAREIAILATPGKSFVFSGTVTFLDLHTGRLGILDPRNGERYLIIFDAATLPASADLSEGSEVTVSANFTGDQYVAQSISVVPVDPEK